MPCLNNNHFCEITSKDERFATIALSEANKSQMKYHKHGCVAVVGGHIIEKGFNSERCQSSDGFLQDTCSCHAEVDVMRKLDKRFNKKQPQMSGRNIKSCGRVNLYVVRQDNRGERFKESAPCSNCSTVMKSLNIKNIIWSNSEGTLTKCRVRDYTTSHVSQGYRFIDRGMIPREYI